MPVPLITIEEHHEAFFVWNWAVHVNYIPSHGCTLLHVDEHADMALPRLREALPERCDLEAAADFTYSELGINNFIWPAVYQGLFHRVFWLRVAHAPTAGSWRRVTVYPTNSARTEFATAIGDPSPDLAARGRTIEYAPITTGQRYSGSSPVVLDIDLDYFCWNDYPDIPEYRVEISAAAYNDFHRDRYHFLRIAPSAKISAIADKGHFYLRYEDIPKRTARVTPRETVEKRLAGFAQYLRRWEIKPALVVVCRSLYSGYTQREYAGMVEREVIAFLDDISPVESYTIDELLSYRDEVISA